MKPVRTSIVNKPIGFICRTSEKSKSNKIKYKFVILGIFKVVAKIKHKKRSGYNEYVLFILEPVSAVGIIINNSPIANTRILLIKFD